MTRSISALVFGYLLAEIPHLNSMEAMLAQAVAFGIALGWCVAFCRAVECAPNARARESGELLNPARGKKPMAEYVGALSCDSAECSLNYTGRCDRCGVELRAP